MKMQPFEGTGAEWDAMITALPQPHLLQTWEWAQMKAAYGWEPMPFVWPAAAGECQAAAMVLKRHVLRRGFTARLCILYAPKGPLLDASNGSLRRQVLDDLQQLGKRESAILLKIDPDVQLGWGVPGEPGAVELASGRHFEGELVERGWRFSNGQVQFRNTVLLDLTASEEHMLESMKPKTRYNVRLAEKKGVQLRAGTLNDIPLLYRMYAETSVRDHFVIRHEGYYRTVWTAFMATPEDGLRPHAEPLIAEVDGEAVAAIFVFYFAGRAYYLYGMSRDAHREKMPNYLLQWEAMKRARGRGCTAYDLWGAPDEFSESDPLWGVFRFKEGLGGRVVRTPGAWDYPASPFWFRLYTQVMPRILDVMRRRGRARTAQALE
ncbi:MAG TPA: peptidoglycan bridge formation glycyltransferase FemA/FemB family protein [Anaerolineales bacterium]|nr:peptidoglycan bridge formation glycyltransferase FemA/FemB family protein [Anaerolineales bacterium]